MDIGIIVGIIGVFVGVIGVFLAWVGLRSKQPCWDVRSNNIIQGYSSKLSDLKVLYKDILVENLTVSKILFWNVGREAIDSSDINTVDHVKIIGSNSGIKVLDVNILSVNNDANKFTCILSEDKIFASLNFDYLNYGDGAVIQVIHTGISSDEISINGSIKNVKKIRRKRARNAYLILPTPIEFDKKIPPNMRRIINTTVVIILLLIITYVGMYYYLTQTNQKFDYFSIFFLIILIIPLLISLVRIWRRSIPKGLNIFEE
jgi:hypothetical protein